MNKAKQTDAKDRAQTRNLLPLVALGGGLATTPAMAVELGELTVNSSLGQPLRASIAYALAPNEMVSDTCVSLSSGRSTGGLPGIGPSSIRITESAIVITGQSAIREPMLGARVTINCPYTPNISREYMLFVDPAPVAQAQLDTVAPVARPEETPVISGTATPVVAERPAPVQLPVGQSTSYQVQPGETLSDIVSRIPNREVRLWPAVNAIFVANPDAFIDNDPNKLKAGSWLEIPSLDGSAPVVSTAVPQPVEAVTPAETVEPAADSSATVDEIAAAYDPAAFDEIAQEPVETIVDETVELPVEADVIVTDSTADLKPGDVIIDTQLEGPETISESPNVPTAVVSTTNTTADTKSSSLWMWLIGGGIAIIGGLVLLARRSRTQDDFTPLQPPSSRPVERRIADTPVIEVEEIEQSYDIEDDSPTEENLALDADLAIGTGLDEGVDVDLSQDFGFASTTELDLELPFEPEAPVDDTKTDMIPPMRNVESILESEVLPEADEDEYDMSVIVDATQMPEHDDVTERDLKAVAVEDFTISQEADYNILEQDYEDELTATQALNQEIEKAAASLAEDLNATTDDEATAEMQLASVHEIDSTAELPVSDVDATVEQEKKTEFEASYDPNDTNAVTVNMTGEDKTAEMPAAGNDETAEMEISGGKVDTKS